MKSRPTFLALSRISINANLSALMQLELAVSFSTLRSLLVVFALLALFIKLPELKILRLVFYVIAIRSQAGQSEYSIDWFTKTRMNYGEIAE